MAMAMTKLSAEQYAAMPEGIGLFGAVCAYVCNEKLFLIAPAVALVALMLVFPTAGRFASC